MLTETASHEGGKETEDFRSNSRRKEAEPYLTASGSGEVCGFCLFVF